MKLPARLQQLLARRKLGVRWASASLGVGERVSKTKGSGMEFADHRPYQPGDDIRHIDPYLQARLGQLFVRQYSMYQQLQCTLLLDASASMQNKWEYSLQVTEGLLYTALAGGDQVSLAVFNQRGLRFAPTYRGLGKVAEASAWLERQKPDGQADFSVLPKRLGPRLRQRSLLVVVSDFLSEEVPQMLPTLNALRQEMVGVQVLAPEERDPAVLGQGGLRLADVESGEEIEMVLDSATLERYKTQLEHWNLAVRQGFQQSQGRYFLLYTDADLERVFLRDFQVGGLVR